MTIVAAYSINSRPVIFADMMLTTVKRPGQSGIRNPNAPYSNTVLGEIGLADAGAVRKALIIDRNLAVAWAGNFESAKRVIRRLQAAFADARATYEALQAVFSDSDDIPADQWCTFVGWIESNGPKCFQWDSRNAHSLSQGPEFVAGSGAKTFLEMVNQPVQKGQSDGLAGEELVEYVLASRIASSLGRDWVDYSTTRSGFGYWYEAILQKDDGKFYYIDDIQFCAIAFDFDDGGNLLLTRRPTIIVQARSKKRFAVVQTTWLPETSDAQTEKYVAILSDGVDELADLHAPAQELTHIASHQCWSIEASIANRGHAHLMLVTEKKSGLAWTQQIGKRKILLRFNYREIFSLLSEQFAIAGVP